MEKIFLITILLYINIFCLIQKSASVNDTIKINFCYDIKKIKCQKKDSLYFINYKDSSFVFCSKESGTYNFLVIADSIKDKIDSVKLVITDNKPVLKINKRQVITDVGEVFSFDIDIKDDGFFYKVYFDFDSDGKIDTTLEKKDAQQLIYSTPTLFGSKDTSFATRISVIDDDSNFVQDSAFLNVYFSPPIADAGYNFITCINKPYLINASGSKAYKNRKISTYIWDFNGDGIIDTSVNDPKIECAFYEICDYYCILRVSDEAGNISCPDSIIVSVMKDKPNVSVKPDIEIKKGTSVEFFGKARSNCSAIERYRWDFDNDGIWDFSSRMHGRCSHTYKKSGTYLARFQAKDSKGQTSATTRIVKVKD